MLPIAQARKRDEPQSTAIQDGGTPCPIDVGVSEMEVIDGQIQLVKTKGAADETNGQARATNSLVYVAAPDAYNYPIIF